MTPWQIAFLGAYGVVLAAMLWLHVVCHRTLRRTTRLAAMPPRPWEGDDYWPFISIVIPAKDEAAGIAECLQTLLAQDYPHFEVLVVDDRSTDGTAAVVERTIRHDRRVRLVGVAELPVGWTGKSHALHVGRKQARGDWLLFLDADTRHHVSCLTAAMREALQRRADLVSVVPRRDPRTLWESVISTYAALCLAAMRPLRRARDAKRCDGEFASGQFLLVRASAYEQIGGHAAIRDMLDDGRTLIRNARRAGLRTRIALGPAVARMHRRRPLRATVAEWRRRAYVAADRSPARLCGFAGAVGLLSLTPCGVLAATAWAATHGASGTFVAAAFAMGVVHEGLHQTLCLRAYRAVGARRRWLPLRWLGAFAMLYILSGALGLCRTRRVVWRGTTYDLSRPAPTQPSPGPDKRWAAA